MRKPNVQAEASAVPRAALQAPCRAGSQELLQRASSWEASSGEPPFDLPGSRGVPLPASQNACSGRDLRGHGAQPHWTDGSSGALRGAGPGQGHTVLTQGGLSSSKLLLLPLTQREASREGLLFPVSAVGVHFPSKLRKFKGSWNGAGGWGGAWTAQGGEWVFKSQRLLYPLRF